MPHRLRGMPIAPEVPTLQRQIGRNRDLLARSRPQQRAVIPNAQPHLSARRFHPRELAARPQTFNDP